MGSTQLLDDGHRRGGTLACPNVLIDGLLATVPAGRFRARTAASAVPPMAERLVMTVDTPLMCVSDLDRCP